jgi:hypothetical protein
MVKSSKKLGEIFLYENEKNQPKFTKNAKKLKKRVK